MSPISPSPAKLMKKIYFIFSFFLVTSFQLPVTSHSISFSDIFPPLKMTQDSVLSNPPATDVKTIGPQGVSDKTFINQLEKSVTCKSKITVDNSWHAKQEDVLDKLRNVIDTIFKYPYNANDLKGGKDFEKLSNPYARLVGAQYSNRNISNVDTEILATNFKDLSLGGYGYMSKIYSIDQKHCLQGQALEEVFKSIDGEDTNYADIQRGWECNGSFVPMDGKNYNESCRPITVGEIAYFYYKNPTIYEKDPLLYENCETMIPKPLPDMNGYAGVYQNQHKKSINFLSYEIYSPLREDLPIKALGPMNQKLTLTNYENVCNQWPNFTPCEETKVNKNRNIPFGAAGNPNLSNQISSITAPKDPENDFASDFNCDNFTVIENNPEVVDTPPVLQFVAYVVGLVRGGIRDEPSWSYQHGNPLSTKTEQSSIDVATNTTNDFAFLIPAGEILDRLKSLPASSKTDKDAPIDPGYQSSEVFKTMRSYLHPASWQNL